MVDDLQPHKPAVFTINSLEKARYLHGIWLEEYLWLCFADAGISDVLSGANIASLLGDKEFKDNELDLIASYRNNLVLVECKTANYTDERHQTTLNLAFDKLSSISNRSGGLLAERWFAAARWPNERDSAEQKELADKFRLQAQEQRVVLIEPRYFGDLTDRLRKWKKNVEIASGSTFGQIVLMEWSGCFDFNALTYLLLLVIISIVAVICYNYGCLFVFFNKIVKINC